MQHIERIADLTESAHDGIQPLDQALDQDRLAALIASLRERGWRGPPLVVAGMQCLTGTHRFAAVVALRAEGLDLEIPRVEVVELCGAFGADWGALEDKHRVGDGYDWYEAARHLDEVLPSEVVEYLGLDLH